MMFLGLHSSKGSDDVSRGSEFDKCGDELPLGAPPGKGDAPILLVWPTRDLLLYDYYCSCALKMCWTKMMPLDGFFISHLFQGGTVGIDFGGRQTSHVFAGDRLAVCCFTFMF